MRINFKLDKLYYYLEICFIFNAVQIYFDTC